MKERRKQILCYLLIMVLMAGTLTACGDADIYPIESSVTEAPTIPIETITTPREVSYYNKGNEQLAITDFSVRLFQNCVTDTENTLISPISLLYALAMTANGAANETLLQMEQVFRIPMDTLNPYLSDYLKTLPCTDEYKFHIANSIWLNEDKRFTVKDTFLETNKNFYDATIQKEAFNAGTAKKINGWVKKHTDGMIPNIINEIPSDAVMYLINALAFDAKWQEIYLTHQVRTGNFTAYDGAVKETEFMYSQEQIYLEDENSVGFMKYYKDGKYAFVAILPPENTTISTYITSLNSEKLQEMLQNAKDIKVNAAIPKFETEYSLEMSKALYNLGITDAFDENLADFSGIGTSENGNLFINSVLQKTFISVNETGTKAGAATLIAICDSAAFIEPEEIKTVYLDRPFVYMLIDCEKKIPLFMGTVIDIN